MKDLIVLGAALILLAPAGATVHASTRGENPSRSAREHRDSLPSSRVGAVPDPLPIIVGELPTPRCWSCPGNQDRPLDFDLDLDHLAPLGTGDGNAALWFADFARPSGIRLPELRDRTLSVELDGQPWTVFRANDPVLLEAEAWVDQARCSSYPAVWQVVGADTPIQNLLFVLTLARSWVARGMVAHDHLAAIADYRRAIRIGRLMRQDDITVIQDLVAIACIRMGAEAIYKQARARGDAATMAAAALVMTDKEAMRARTSEHLAALQGLYSAVELGIFGRPRLAASDKVVDAAFKVAKAPERRFVLESLLAVQLIHELGTAQQRARAEALLEQLGKSEDAVVSRRANEVRSERLTSSQLRAMVEGFSR